MREWDLVGDEVWRRVAYFERAATVADYVRAHFRGQVTLAAVADVAGMERTAFSRFFAQRVGITFSSFLRRYRLSVAVHTMQSRDLTLREVAERSGFNSLATMERAFKSITGSPPSRYRRKVLARTGIVPAATRGTVPARWRHDGPVAPFVRE